MFRKAFLVEIDLEWSKTCSKMKIWSLRIFPIEKGHSRFFEKVGLMSQMTIEQVKRVSPGTSLIHTEIRPHLAPNGVPCQLSMTRVELFE